MSVMIQSYRVSSPVATNSSAEANPLTPYPSEWSDSTSAALNESSSSMTASESSLDTFTLSPGGSPHNKNAQDFGALKLYSSITLEIGPHDFRHPNKC